MTISRSRALAVVSLAAVLSGCAPEGAADPAEPFLANYHEFCGHAYPGHSAMVDLGEDHELENADLVMILEECAEDEVRIPFWVNGDRSRTWIVRETEEGLHLSHDHRYPDGTEYDQNMYGGYADERGNPTKQFFPADDRTIAERPARDINVWSKEFDLANDRYYYRLYLRDELRYEAEFDLSNPLPIDSVRQAGAE